MIQKYEKFQNKNIGILGLGEENIALVRYLFKNDFKNITICDKKGIDEINGIDDIKTSIINWQAGQDYLDNLEEFDIVYRSPGIPYLDSQIQKAKNSGVEISSQTKLFFDQCPCPIIGVTGTKGKGTTSTLISEILAHSKQLTANSQEKKAVSRKPLAVGQVYLGGNIGNAPIEFLDKLMAEDIVVLELSSFQLQDLEKSPHIGVVLNITSDHLDVHQDNKEYIQAKTNIIAHQTKNDFAVINADYLTSVEYATMTQAQVYWFSRKKSVDAGAWVGDNTVFYREGSIDNKIVETQELQLRGQHNWENICAAVTVVRLVGVDFETISTTVKSFKGLEHRLEFVSVINGVKFYNDSFSTTPETAIAAIASFSEPIILIAGGSEKNADYSQLGEIISKSNIKTIITIGLTGPRIKSAIKNQDIKIIDTAKNLVDVMDIVRCEMQPGDVVLLSPASASFDWFANYKERGLEFKKEVISLE